MLRVRRGTKYLICNPLNPPAGVDRQQPDCARRGLLQRHPRRRPHRRATRIRQRRLLVRGRRQQQQGRQTRGGPEGRYHRCLGQGARRTPQGTITLTISAKFWDFPAPLLLSHRDGEVPQMSTSTQYTQSSEAEDLPVQSSTEYSIQESTQYRSLLQVLTRRFLYVPVIPCTAAGSICDQLKRHELQ